MSRPVIRCPKSRSLLLAALLGSGLAHATDSRAEVRVHAEHRGGEILYRYEVQNRDAARLDTFALGCECRTPGERVALAQLDALPAGTSVTGEDHLGLVLQVPPDKLTTPPGWHATVRAPVDGSRYWIEWHTYDPAAAISANQSLAGFAIAVPAADPALLAGSYLVSGAAGRSASGRVRPADTVPPRLTVQLHLRGAGDPEGTVAVATEVNVNDDVDPEPRVHLETFSREGPGDGEAGTSRLALTYRATDASGNTTRETARIALPGTLAGVVGLPTPAILP